MASTLAARFDDVIKAAAELIAELYIDSELIKGVGRARIITSDCYPDSVGNALVDEAPGCRARTNH